MEVAFVVTKLAHENFNGFTILLTRKTKTCDAISSDFFKVAYRISSKERPGRSLKVGIRGEALKWGGGSFDRETAVILEAELKKRKELSVILIL